MIKNIHITRALVSPSETNPSQWSDNGQLSINNGHHLTVLDPKIPNFHKAVVSQTEYNKEGNYQNMLCTEELFDQTTILQLETLRLMDICNFNRVKVTSNTNLFYFTRIIEPEIVKHLWAPSATSSRDCRLGVLLNTGELLVLQRSSKLLQLYETIYGFFKITSNELKLNPTVGDELEVDEQQFLQLKIKDFEFLSYKGMNVIVILNEADELKVYNGDDILFTCMLPSSCKIKPFVKDGEIFIAFTTLDNGLIIYSRKDDSFVTVIEPSRFKIGHFVWHEQENALIASNSLAIYVYQNNVLNYTNSTEKKVSSIIPTDQDVIIAYECGKFDYMNVKQVKLKPVEYLNNHFNTILLDYQVSSALNNHNESTKLLIQNASINKVTGVLTATFKFIADKHVSYKILSKNDFYIEFVKLEGIKPNDNYVTSLAYISSLWINHFDELTVFPKNFQIITSLQFVNQFKDKLVEFKSKHFDKVEKLNYDKGLNREITVSLEDGYIRNSKVIMYQRLYNINLIISNGINNLISKLETFDLPPEIKDQLQQYLTTLEEEQTAIKRVLRQYLFDIIRHSDIEVLTDIDKYVLISYYIACKDDTDTFEMLPFKEETVSITISTEYVTEIFTASLDMNFTELAVSESNHAWSRCALTLLPLLDEENRIDELNQFNYILNKNFGGFIDDLLSSLNYCIFTGNKVYRTG